MAGEMLELGDHAPILHYSCGKAAAEAGIDFVVGVRGNAEHLAAAACTARRARHYFYPMPKLPANGLAGIFARATWCWSKAPVACTWSEPSKLQRLIGRGR